MQKNKMKSTAPYLIRAMYEWIVDSGMTPYLVVNTKFPNTSIPEKFTENNQIVLDISDAACRHLELSNTYISLVAKFSGCPYNLNFRAGAVTAIYAEENGKGMIFDSKIDNDEYLISSEDTETTNVVSIDKKPNLRLIKY